MTPGGRLLLDGLLLAAGLALASVVVEPVAPGSELPAALTAARPDSGVSHPVTAVLLNFRGYDTLLEMLVLLLALLGVRSLGALPPMTAPAPPSPVLGELLRLLTPLLVLVAAYLLWRGASGPGGAFQAGAVLGAAGVLWLLAERPSSRGLERLPLRPLLVVGVGVFVAIGLCLAVTEGAFLAYPVAYAGGLIFLIEALATLSIAVTLVALFVGARSAGPSSWPR